MSDSKTDFSARVAELEASIQRLEAIAELTALKATYAMRVDENHRAPTRESALAAVAMFTDDAVLDLGPHGRYVGRDEILRAFTNIFPNSVAWSVHYVMNPVLNVQGSAASGTFSFLLYIQPKTSPPFPVLTYHGFYEERYEKTPRGWRFKEVKATMGPSPAGA